MTLTPTNRSHRSPLPFVFLIEIQIDEQKLIQTVENLNFILLIDYWEIRRKLCINFNSQCYFGTICLHSCTESNSVTEKKRQIIAIVS